VLTKKEMLDELQLTDSKLEAVEVMIEKEVQIRIEIALLEADAAAKMKAAEEAIRRAKSFLNEANTMQEARSGGNNNNKSEIKANTTAVDAIAQMIAIAEKETVAENEPVEDGRADSVHHEAPSTRKDKREEISGQDEEREENSSTESIDKELDCLQASLSTENVVAQEEMSDIGSPPSIIRQTSLHENTDEAAEVATEVVEDTETHSAEVAETTAIQVKFKEPQPKRITEYFKPKPEISPERPKPERVVEKCAAAPTIDAVETGEVLVKEVEDTEETTDENVEGDAPDSNVAIESAEQDDSEVVEEDLATSPSEDKAVDDADDADEIDTDVEDIDESDDATSKTSNSLKKLEENKEVDDKSNNANEEEISISRTFSMLTTASVSDDNNNDNFDGIEGTMILLLTKIDECRAKLTDPSSSLDEQTAAAQLMTQFAKTAKAFKKAF